MLKFTTQSLLQITDILEENLSSLEAKSIIKFQVINPDRFTSLYSGNEVEINGEKYIYRGYKNWSDLAYLLKCRMLTPILENENLVTIRYEKLNSDVSFHSNSDTPESKYGKDSIFSQIHKNRR